MRPHLSSEELLTVSDIGGEGSTFFSGGATEKLPTRQ